MLKHSKKLGRNWMQSQGLPLHGLTWGRLLLNMFFLSPFSYCPLVWMFHTRGKNSNINRLQGRCLRIIYIDKISTFIELLEKDKSVSIHKWSLLFLIIETLKFKKGFASALCKEMISQNRPNTYELRNNADFTLPLVKSVHKDLEKLSFLGPKNWEI